MRLKPLVAASAAVTVTAAVGGLATTAGTQWFRELERPSWQPPDAVFGPVWTVLYAGIAVSAAAAWDAVPGRQALGPVSSSRRRVRRRLVAAYGINLGLNAAWSVLFFRQRRISAAAVDSGLLLASTVGLLVATRGSRTAAVTLWPYAAWVAFATALTAEIGRRNS